MREGRSVVVVTGANGSLGKAVTSWFANKGADVVAVERTRVVEQSSGREIAPIDLSDPVSSERAFQSVVEQKRHIDAVVHTVGGFRFSGPIAHADTTDFRSMFEAHVLTTAHLLRAVVPLMMRASWGSIVVVVSRGAKQGQAGTSAYGASKAAELSLVQSVAAELVGTNVRLNAVLPGTMDTPQNRAQMPTARFDSWASVDEVAAAIGFLTSPDAKAIHGEALVVGNA